MVNNPNRIQDREAFIQAVETCTDVKIGKIGRPQGEAVRILCVPHDGLLAKGAIPLIHWVNEHNSALATLYLIKGKPVINDKFGQLPSRQSHKTAKSWSATL